MNYFAYLNSLLEKYPAFIGLAIVALFAYNAMQTNQVKAAQEDMRVAQVEIFKAIDIQTYEFAFGLIERGFAGTSSSVEVLSIVQNWEDNDWGAQLVALDILCEQPGRGRLLELVPIDTGTGICRIVR